MQVWQLRNVLQGVPDKADVYCSLGSPLPNSSGGAYEAHYDMINNRFYVEYNLNNMAKEKNGKL